MSNEKSKESHIRDILTGLVLIVAITGIWYYSSLFIDKNIFSNGKEFPNHIEARGQFGDKFGAINALFSGLAFAGIIFTIFLQKRELSLQREELQETRNEFIQQNETLKKQRFENTFFQLLSLHTEIVDKLRITAIDGNTYEKREFFVGAIRDLKYRGNYGYYKYSALIKLDPNEISRFKANRDVDHDFYQNLDKDEVSNLKLLSNTDIDNFISEPVENKEDNIRKEYEIFFHRYQYNLGHYFRNLYHIFKYVYTTQLIPIEEKQFYCNIVRAQLSSDELLLVFYNSLTPICYYSDKPNLGFPKFKYLIDKFDILQNMNDRLLLDKAHMHIFNTNKVESEPESFRGSKNEL